MRSVDNIPARMPRWAFVVVFTLAFAVRLYGIGHLPDHIFDEGVHVPNAHNYVHYGYLAPANWYHPPGRHVILYGSIALLGDNAYGWRMPNIISGAATVLMVFVFGLYLFRLPVTTYIATALLLFDPLHILLSRGTTEDIPATLFLLVGVYLGVRGIAAEKGWLLAGSGLMFGLSTSLKWYAIIPGFVVLAAALVRRRGEPWRTAEAASYLGALPLMTYLPWYRPWFSQGYSFAEWVGLHTDTLRSLRHMTEAGFDPLLAAIGTPTHWFVAPVGLGFQVGGQGSWQSFMVLMNNPPVWILLIPALVYMIVRGAKTRRADYVVIGGCALLLYVSFLLVARPMYVYVAATILPFAFLALGMAVTRILRRAAYAFLTAISAMGTVLYPLVSGGSVPTAFYSPVVLRYLEIVSHLE